MAAGAELHMLMDLGKLLDQAQDVPMRLEPETVVEIGSAVELNESQAYRTFNRLHRQGKIVGEGTPSNEHPAGWIVFWLADVKL